ncbi:transcriptional regulator ATRX homolog isoform X1 [Myxocyprinus asiaticus]|uniref:transcriptional regulator ATRX homolog isoform X1 n=1 Tax=Myxocyprinus asiaticus TaxID=70543 RepID=UPI002222CFBA|nr:transcriptional regulator ATRX homolog isoform X1 [Myxocyprinus asiaticus]
MVKEEDAIRKFVVKQLQQCSDLSALTLGILRKRYLEQVGRESLNMKDRQSMKKIVEEELLKMQVSSDDEPLVKFVAPPKIESKRKRVDDDGDEGLENKVVGRTKRSRLDETSPDSPDSGIEKAMNEAGQKEEQAGSDHTDEDNEEEQEKKSTMKTVTQQKQNKRGGKQSSKGRDNKKKKKPEKRWNKVESEEEEDDELDDSDEEGGKQNTAKKVEKKKKDEDSASEEETSDKPTKNYSSESVSNSEDERGKSKKMKKRKEIRKKKPLETDAVKEVERQVFGSSSESEDEKNESTKTRKRSSSESEATAESEEEKDKREDAADLSSKEMENNEKKQKLQENQEEEANDSDSSSLPSLEDEEEQEKDKKEGKQKSVTKKKLREEGESATRGKEPSADSDSYLPSDGNNTDTWTSTHEEPSFFEAEPRPSTPLAKSTICGADSTALREEPLPSTFGQSNTPRPQGKHSRKMLDKSSSEEFTNLMHTIGKTLEKLASQENTNDAISAYCKNLEHRMRKLPPHLLPQFQHEVDNCIFKYSVGQNHALEASD